MFVSDICTSAAVFGTGDGPELALLESSLVADRTIALTYPVHVCTFFAAMVGGSGIRGPREGGRSSKDSHGTLQGTGEGATAPNDAGQAEPRNISPNLICVR